jgi:hypothetical protein
MPGFPAGSVPQLLCDQDGEGSAYRAADDADGLPGKRELVQLAVIAGPSLEAARLRRA